MRLVGRGGETNREGAKDAKEEDAEAWFYRGVEQYMAGYFAGAIASWGKAIEFKPDYHQAWHNRGVLLDELD